MKRSILFVGLWLSTAVYPLSSASAEFPLAGLWDGNNWGDVFIVGAYGIYTDRYDFPYGVLELKHAEDNKFEGHWGENAGRGGYLELKLLDDHKTIVGTYSTGPAIRRGHGYKKGKIYWTKRPNTPKWEAKKKELIEKMRLDLEDIRRYEQWLSKIIKIVGDGNQPI